VESKREKEAVEYFRVLFQQLPGRIEDSTDIRSFRTSGTLTTFRPGTSGYRNSRVIAGLTSSLDDGLIRAETCREYRSYLTLSIVAKQKVLLFTINISI
jgi:hypothetical protein